MYINIKSLKINGDFYLKMIKYNGKRIRINVRWFYRKS